jgi:hypothetical protein
MYWLVYYPCSIVLSGMIGFALGYSVNTLIRQFHRRMNSTPPGFGSPRAWGWALACAAGLFGALVPLLLRFVAHGGRAA